MSKRSQSSSNGSSMVLRSPQERKQILRQVIARAESFTISDNTVRDLEQCMEEADNINLETSIDEKIHNQEEVLLDSEMIHLSSKVLKRCTRSLTKHISSYNYIEFAEKLVQYVDQLSDVETETQDWSLLEAQITKCFKTTPNYSTLLGTLAPLEKKEITKRKPVVKEAQAPIKRPENVVTVDTEKEDVEQTESIKEFITRYYKTYRKPLDFFKLVLHPADFGKTIENILHISFLARDGKIKLTKDDSGMLVILPCTKDMILQATKAGKGKNIQNVIYINMEQWKTLKDAYRLEKPMLNFG